MISIPESMRARFESKVDRSGGPDACWTWTPRPHASAASKSYGQMRVVLADGATATMVRTHRIAYYFSKGPIPDGMVVMHSCDNPPCCNPAHLSIGTQAENMADCDAKGRGWPYYKYKFGPRKCKECGADCVHSRCNSCAKERRDAARAKSLADRGYALAKMTCSKCLQRGHRRTNCTWEPTIKNVA